MNFLKEVELGRQGNNKGLTTGSKELDSVINSIQKAHLYTIGGPPASGKSTFLIYCFIIQPYLYSLKNPDINLRFIFRSLEMRRVEVEAKVVATFFALDHNISRYKYKGEEREINSNYILGRELDQETGELIPLEEGHYELIQQIYQERIIPMFGEYDEYNRKIKPGVILFSEERYTNNQFFNTLHNYAKTQGKFIQQGDSEIYIPNDPKAFTLILTDHIRKIKKEGFPTLYDAINDYSDQCLKYKNKCMFTFVNLVHIEKIDVDKLKYSGEFIYPAEDNLKGSANLSEDSETIITLFNPNDNKYNLEKHFGLSLKTNQGVIKYPLLRSIHVVKNRYGKFPYHMQVALHGGLGIFSKLDK